MEKEIVTRQTLYEMVWSESISSLIRKYDISYVSLREVCSRMKIPLPGTGYWRRLRFGKEGPPEPLSNDYSGEQEVTLLLKSEQSEDKQIDNSPLAVLQRDIESDTRLNLKVPSKLTLPDKLIQRAEKGFAERIKGRHLDNGLVRAGWDELDINVGTGNVERSLRIMDTIVKALRARGHNLETGHRSTFAIIKDQKIMISILEKSLRTIVPDGKWNRQELSPSGKLAFRMKKDFQMQEWVDGKQPLEYYIARIIAELELHGEDLRLERIEREKHWAEEKAKEQIQKAAKEKRDKELHDFKDLLQLATRSRQAEDLRRFLDKVEQAAISNNTMTEEFRARLAWGRAKADWYDPVIETKDTLLTGVDRNAVTPEEKSNYCAALGNDFPSTPWHPNQKQYWKGNH